MTAKSSTKKKPTAEETAAEHAKEREIFATQAEMGLHIAHNLASELFGGERADSVVVIAIYDALQTDAEGEFSESQDAFKADVERVRAVAKSLSGEDANIVDGKTVMEFHYRMFGRFDEQEDDE
jgi:hypothetical protein